MYKLLARFSPGFALAFRRGQFDNFLDGQFHHMLGWWPVRAGRLESERWLRRWLPEAARGIAAYVELWKRHFQSPAFGDAHAEEQISELGQALQSDARALLDDIEDQCDLGALQFPGGVPYRLQMTFDRWQRCYVSKLRDFLGVAQDTNSRDISAQSWFQEQIRDQRWLDLRRTNPRLWKAVDETARQLAGPQAATLRDEWLAQLSKHHVDDDVASRLTESDLKDMGFVGIGVRLKLLQQFGPGPTQDYWRPEKTSETWTDLIGWERIKECVDRSVWRRLDPQTLDFAAHLGLPKSKVCTGILLFGPPGTGKTKCARILANELKASFFNVEVSSLLSKFVGESEQQVARLFETARNQQTSMSLIFIDEVDSLLGRRQSEGDEISRRFKSEFLAQWDGARTHGSSRVVVVGATNLPQALDDAVVRPGRFEELIFVPAPDEDGRAEMSRRMLRTRRGPPSEELVDFLKGATPHFSGADLDRLCRRATEIAQEACQSGAMDLAEFGVKLEHLEKALREVVASTRPGSKDYTAMVDWALKKCDSLTMSHHIRDALRSWQKTALRRAANVGGVTGTTDESGDEVALVLRWLGTLLNFNSGDFEEAVIELQLPLLFCVQGVAACNGGPATESLQRFMRGFVSMLLTVPECRPLFDEAGRCPFLHQSETAQSLQSPVNLPGRPDWLFINAALTAIMLERLVEGVALARGLERNLDVRGLQAGASLRRAIERDLLARTWEALTTQNVTVSQSFLYLTAACCTGHPTDTMAWAALSSLATSHVVDQEALALARLVLDPHASNPQEQVVARHALEPHERWVRDYLDCFVRQDQLWQLTEHHWDMRLQQAKPSADFLRHGIWMRWRGVTFSRRVVLLCIGRKTKHPVVQAMLKQHWADRRMGRLLSQGPYICPIEPPPLDGYPTDPEEAARWLEKEHGPWLEEQLEQLRARSAALRSFHDPQGEVLSKAVAVFSAPFQALGAAFVPRPPVMSADLTEGLDVGRMQALSLALGKEESGLWEMRRFAQVLGQQPEEAASLSLALVRMGEPGVLMLCDLFSRHQNLVLTPRLVRLLALWPNQFSLESAAMLRLRLKPGGVDALSKEELWVSHALGERSFY